MRQITNALFIFAALSGSGAAQYKQTNLVGDKAGMAAYTDSNLKDPWGLAFFPAGPFFIADAHSGLVTLYGADGKPESFRITVPPVPGQPAGTLGSPTGLVTNSTAEFVISKNGKSGPAVLLMDTLDGLICGWNPAIDPSNAIVIKDNSTVGFGASYTGLALGRNSKGQQVLYAADSGSGPTTSNNRITMYDGKFNPIGSFGDLSAPANMTVFNVQNVGGKLYVSYAAFAPLNGGVVDEFDTDGHLLKHFASNSPAGPLQEPWAVVQAPDDFGRFRSAILIGNLGDGRINAYDPKTGTFLGQLKDDHGNPISSGLGLWGLAFNENRVEEGDKKRLYFASGVNGEADGLFGFITTTGGRDD